MDVQSLGYRTDLMIRVLEGGAVEDRGDCLVIRSPRNQDFWWGNFLLLSAPPAPGRAGVWLDRFAAEFPGATHVALGIDVARADDTDPAELVAAGLRFVRLAVLTAGEVRPPPRPAAAMCRKLSGDDDWRRAELLRAVVSGGGPGGEPGFVRARITAERAMCEAGHSSWYGAFADGELLAQLGVITGHDGLARYQNVETHPAARRRGLAGTLVWHAGRETLSAGRASTLVIVTDPLETAISVYQSAGFTTAQEQVGFERESPAR